MDAGGMDTLPVSTPPAAEASGVPVPVVPLRTDMHFALLVGINKYPGLPTSLRGPRNDAKDFYDWLIAPDGGNVPKGNIRHVDVNPDAVTELRTARPNRDDVHSALDELLDALGNRLKADMLDWQYSRLYVYLSGHGIAPNAREAALLMANAMLGKLGESIPCAAYMNFFQDQQTFRELVFFADCCRTLKAQAQLLPPPWDRTTSTRGQVVTVIGFAAAFGNLAYEPTPQEVAEPDLARGYFTKALLEGLRGNAADKATGEINSDTLARYVKQRVLDLTSGKPSPQEALLNAAPLTPAIVFRPVAPVPRWPVTISLPQGFAGTAVLMDGSRVEQARHDGAGGPWTVQLTNGLYEVRPADQPDGSVFANDGLFRITGVSCNVDLARK